MSEEPNEVQGPRMVECQKLGKTLEGLERRPFKNELGQRIYEGISKEAWQMWIEHSKMLVNENRIDVMSPQGREFLLQECEKFLFRDDWSKPAGYVPQS